jgi:very-short-patch-repair endonuclease
MKKHPTAGARQRARSLRQNMTEAERRIWQMLRSHQMAGYGFRRQVPIGRYIADFVCREARLIVEIDGGQHDRASPQEAERGRFLQSEGYRILRFWNNEVLANLDGVHQTTVDWLAGAPPPQPSPIEGEGAQRQALPLDGGGLGGGDAPHGDGGGSVKRSTRSVACSADGEQ